LYLLFSIHRLPSGARHFTFEVFRPALEPIHPPVQWLPGTLSPGSKASRSVQLTTHLHLVPRLRMSKAVSPLPCKFLLYGASTSTRTTLKRREENRTEKSLASTGNRIPADQSVGTLTELSRLLQTNYKIVMIIR
jgi:hypothetical protein